MSDDDNIFEKMRLKTKAISRGGDSSKVQRDRRSESVSTKHDSEEEDEQKAKSSVEKEDEEKERQENKIEAKKKKTARELKKLAFDNKKFNLDASDADFSCELCGETFLYETQLKSHRVYVHFKPKASTSAQSGDSSTQAEVIRYTCNICSKIKSSVQSYLKHFAKKGCKDNEKRRLKAFDSCVCMLCGFATTRAQLSSHLRDEHVDELAELEPTNEAEGVYSCPMCVSDVGGNVVVASGFDLLFHLSTWHPTAVVLDRGSPVPEKKKVKKKDRETEAYERSSNLLPSDYRRCFGCQATMPKVFYWRHRRWCVGNRQESHRSVHPQAKLVKSKVKPRKKKLFMVQKSSLSALKPTSIEKLRLWKNHQKKGDSNGGSVEMVDNESLSPERMPSTSAVAPDSRTADYGQNAAGWSKPTRAWKKPHACTNCRKEFNQSVEFFVHMVNRFCHGNRGQAPESTLCPLCNQAVTCAPAMLEHVRRNHCGSDGLQVDKSVRIEFNELASEIIGYKSICGQCGRGYHSKTRCNSSKPHFGTKVPVQEILSCRICSQRVKSEIQMRLHLWAMHNFVTSMITKAISGGDMPDGKAAYLETISEYFALKTFESARTTACKPYAEVPLLLKCSSCTTRFASMDTLRAHNAEFHEGSRRDDKDFEIVSKIFFYRQNDSQYQNGTLFDDMLNNEFSMPSPPSIAPPPHRGIRVVKTSSDPPSMLDNCESGGLPVVLGAAPALSDQKNPRKRKEIRTEEESQKKIKISAPIASIPPPPLQARPDLALPRLVRIPTVPPRNNFEVITLDDDRIADQRQNGVPAVGATVNVSSYVPLQAFPNWPPGPSTAAPQSTSTPVLIRAFSLRPPSIVPAPAACLTISSDGRLVTPATLASKRNEMTRYVNGLQPRPIGPVRMAAPGAVAVPLVISVSSAGSVLPGTSRLIIRPLRSPAATEQPGKNLQN